MDNESIIELPTENIQLNDDSISEDHKIEDDQIIETIVITEKPHT